MSAKKWPHCKGGLKCWLDPLSKYEKQKHKRGCRRLTRRQNRADTIQRSREAA